MALLRLWNPPLIVLRETLNSDFLESSLPLPNHISEWSSGLSGLIIPICHWGNGHREFSDSVEFKFSYLTYQSFTFFYHLLVSCFCIHLWVFQTILSSYHYLRSGRYINRQKPYAVYSLSECLLHCIESYWFVFNSFTDNLIIFW